MYELIATTIYRYDFSLRSREARIHLGVLNFLNLILRKYAQNLTLQITIVIIHRAICCLDDFRDNLSRSCGTDRDVHFSPTITPDVMPRVTSFELKLK
jgi:hypothetical protein